MTKQRNLPGEPMTLGNIGQLGVQWLVAYCPTLLARADEVIE